MKKNLEDKKDSEVKITPNTFTNHNRSSCGQSSQSGQTLDQSAKKSSYLYQDKKLDKSSSILATEINVIVVQKNKKHGDNNLSQVKYFTYYKKSWYANMCPNKELKIYCWSWQTLYQ